MCFVANMTSNKLGVRLDPKHYPAVWLAQLRRRDYDIFVSMMSYRIYIQVGRAED